MVEQYSRSVLFCCAADRNEHKHARGIAVYMYHTVKYMYNVVLCTMVCERENNKQKLRSHLVVFTLQYISTYIFHRQQDGWLCTAATAVNQAWSSVLRTFGLNVFPELIVRATSLPTPAPEPVEWLFYPAFSGVPSACLSWSCSSDAHAPNAALGSVVHLSNGSLMLCVTWSSSSCTR